MSKEIFTVSVKRTNCKVKTSESKNHQWALVINCRPLQCSEQ